MCERLSIESVGTVVGIWGWSSRAVQSKPELRHSTAHARVHPPVAPNRAMRGLGDAIVYLGLKLVWGRRVLYYRALQELPGMLITDTS